LQTENLAKSGNWWIPCRQEKQFHGELNFNQTEGGTLLLSDTLDKLYDFPIRNEDFIMVGDLTEEGKDETTKVSVLISLMTSHQEKNSPNENSIKIVLLLKYIFLGVHVDKNIELEKIVVSYSNLNKWISVLHDLEVDRSQEERIYNSPAITVNDECRIQITSSPTFQKVDSKTIIEDNIRIKIKSLGDKSFSHYLGLEGKFRDFLNFVITKGAVIVQSFEGFVKQESEITSLQKECIR
jgi:hypothetical protein